MWAHTTKNVLELWQIRMMRLFFFLSLVMIALTGPMPFYMVIAVNRIYMFYNFVNRNNFIAFYFVLIIKFGMVPRSFTSLPSKGYLSVFEVEGLWQIRNLCSVFFSAHNNVDANQSIQHLWTGAASKLNWSISLFCVFHLFCIFHIW